jgi:inner membrane transporter RhtA
MALASLILLAVWRPWRMRLKLHEMRVIVMYGLSMGCMNFFFYLSLRSIPLGIAVALEFAGPLALAMAASRRAIDFLWVLMAALGLLALLPLGFGSQPLNTAGVGCALVAGLFWALYIYFGRKAGAAHGGQTTALGMVAGAIVIVPIGVAEAGAHLLSTAILPAALGVALLSSALPYSLEMLAMPLLPTRTVGVLMSLDPALGALSGLCFLGERLSWIQWAAIASIMAASAGSAATSRDAEPQLLPD